MKRILIVLGLVVVLGIGSAFVYADGGSDKESNLPKDYENMEEWHGHMMERRKDDLRKAVDEGEISKEDSQKWEEHFNYMEDFHRENGFMGKGWGCHSRRGHGKGMGRMHRKSY